MIFEVLNKAVEEGELVFVDGGMVRFTVRMDNTITINELIVEPEERRKGIGKSLVEGVIEGNPDTVAVVAKCPEDLPGNAFWEALGFSLGRQRKTRAGRIINTWIKVLKEGAEVRERKTSRAELLERELDELRNQVRELTKEIKPSPVRPATNSSATRKVYAGRK